MISSIISEIITALHIPLGCLPRRMWAACPQANVEWFAHLGCLPQANNLTKTAFTHEISSFGCNAYITWNQQKVHFMMCERKNPTVEKQVENAVSK